MAFTPNTFFRLSAVANSDAAAIFTYRTADNTATVVGANYFDPAGAVTGGYGLKNDDLILVQQSDGTDFYEVTVSGAGVVAIVKTNAFA